MLKWQLNVSGLEDALPDRAALTFVTAPHSAASMGHIPPREHSYQWLMDENLLGASEAEQAAEHEKWAVTLELLRGVLKKAAEESQPFDGLLGYSMGTATITSLLASLPAAETRSIRFAIHFCGYPPSQHQQIFASLKARSPLAIASLHAYGRKDEIVKPKQSRWHASFYEQTTCEQFEHAGGHDIPRAPDDVARVARFVAQFA